MASAAFKVRVRVQRSVNHLGFGSYLGNFNLRAILRNFKSPSNKWMVDRKNVIHRKSK